MEKIDYNKIVKEILKNYHKVGRQISLGLADKKLIEKYEFIKKVIETLDQEDKELIKAIYVEKRSVRQLAREGYFARSTFYYREKKIISEIVECLKIEQNCT